MKKEIIFVLISILLLNFLAGCTQKEKIEGEDFSFVTLDGEVKKLSDYRGKIVIVDFMGAGCTPCHYQLVELEKIYDMYSDKVEIIYIDVWTIYGETADDVKNLIKEFEQYGLELKWTFGLDVDGILWNKYVIEKAVPTIYIFDENGQKIFYNVGITSYQELEKYVLT